MDITNQVTSLQDEVKLLKGEIKSILKEIRTAVLSRDNPFAAGLDSLGSDRGGPATAPSASGGAPEPSQPDLPQVSVPTPNEPRQQAPAGPIIIQAGGGAPPAPAWAGPVPAPQPAPPPFTPAAASPPAAPPAAAPPAAAPAPPALAPGPPALAPPPSAQAAAMSATPSRLPVEPDYRPEPQPSDIESAGEERSNEPIPIRRWEDGEGAVPEAPPAPERERPSWSLPALAGLAVWAEDALLALGPRRFHFVLDLATFAELLSREAQEVLSGLIDADALSQEDERPLNVNECLVVLRQLDAIVHGEKIVKLPRRRGIRHRRVR